MRRRSRAREVALKVLYQIDLTDGDALQVLSDFWRAYPEEKPVRDYATRLVRGVVENRLPLDRLLSTYAENWDIKRMAVIDRNILRIGEFELLYVKNVPPKVAINEAIEIAKRYGNRDSGGFVNGILDRVAREKVGLDKNEGVITE